MTKTAEPVALRACLVCGARVPVTRTLCNKKACKRQWAREIAGDGDFDWSPSDTNNGFFTGA